MRILICVPIRDYVERECYEALRRQTYQDRAILIHQLDPIAASVRDERKAKTWNSTRNRNEMRKAALGTDATHFMLVDSDTVLPPDCIEKLLAADKDIISAWCPMIYGDRWIAGRWEGNTFVNYRGPQPGIIEVGMAPLGCMLIKRKVLESITFEAATEELMQDEFGNLLYVGVTTAFGLAAARLGYTLFMHGDLICRHLHKEQYVKT